MYGVLLGESLSADWSNVTRVILHLQFSRARDAVKNFEKRPEEEENDKTRSLITSRKKTYKVLDIGRSSFVFAVLRRYMNGVL